MDRRENLRPPYNSEEARKNGKIGGVKSGQSKRRKKTIVETTNQVLNTVVTDEKQLSAIKRAGLPVPEKPTYRDFIVATVLLKMTKNGRVSDLSVLMEMLGEAPPQIDSDMLKKARELLGGIDSGIG